MEMHQGKRVHGESWGGQRYSLQKLKLPKRTWSGERGNEEGLALLQNPLGWEVWRKVG